MNVFNNKLGQAICVFAVKADYNTPSSDMFTLLPSTSPVSETHNRNLLGWVRESSFVCCSLPVIMWFLFGEVSSSSGCLGWATLFYCGTPCVFHIIILRSVTCGSLSVPRLKTALYDASFYAIAQKLWNALPSDIRTSTSLDNFKKSVKSHFMKCF